MSVKKWLTHWMTAEELHKIAKPGDIIQFEHPGFEHAGIYLGKYSEGCCYASFVGPRIVHGSLPQVEDAVTVLNDDDLIDAAAGMRVRINNSDDVEHEPQSRRRIVKKARIKIGESVVYTPKGHNIVTFTRQCRYGHHQRWIEEERTQWRWLSLISDWHKPEDILPLLRSGDIVEMDYTMFLHSGIFIGKVKGVHTMVHVALIHLKTGKVLESPFVKGCDGHQVRINNSDDIEHRPLSPKEIATLARSKVGEEFEYELLQQNCEIFTTQCRYGSEKGWSKQVDKVTDVLEAPLDLLEDIEDALV